MKFKFSLLVALSAALIAGCAAYYSVFGLSQLFAGASIAVIIMASSLEVAKVVSVSLLQRYWTKLSRGLKIYLMTGVIILVTITSAGIYGFLSNAFQKTASQYEISEGQLSVLNGRKELFEKSILDNKSILETKNKRVQQLTELRANQESRLDAATNTSGKNRARTDINQSTAEIQKLNTEIDALNNKNTTLSDSVAAYSTKVLESKATSGVSGELGPLKYLSELTGQPMNKVVNWFILLLIFVFDPLAVALVIATNRILQLENEKSVTQPEIKTEVKPIEEVVVEPEATVEFDANLELEPESELEIEPEPEPLPVYKREPVIPTGTIKFEDIKEIKERTNRGFTQEIPKPTNNTIQRIGSNKFVKNNDGDKIFFKKKS